MYKKNQSRLRAAAFDRGFGMIEVLIALSLWGFVLLGLTGLFMVSLSAGTAAETSSVAANLARSRLEEIRATPRAEIAKAGNSTDVQRVPPGDGRLYTINTSVDSSHPGFVDVTVTVAWRVTYAAACFGGWPGSCAGTVLPQTRTLQTRLRDP
jgi:prepilin-type N-terminal cleavage/methylation domain-containing protein